jgi:tryptophanase
MPNVMGYILMYHTQQQQQQQQSNLSIISLDKPIPQQVYTQPHANYMP